MVNAPQIPPYEGNGIRAGGWLLVIPGPLSNGSLFVADETGGYAGHNGGEPQQGWGRTADAPVVPLARCVAPEMSPRLCNGGCRRPALDEPGQDRHGGPIPAVVDSHA